MKQWYVVQSKPQKESLLFEQLLLREIEAYYPCIRLKPVNPRSRKINPYFPGYLFVHVDLNFIGISSLKWIPGAIGLVDFGGEPPFIDESVVQAIRQKVEQCNTASSKPFAMLKPGDPVSICEGPFWGYKAIFDTTTSESERVRVLLTVLQNQQIRIELPARQIQPSL